MEYVRQVLVRLKLPSLRGGTELYWRYTRAQLNIIHGATSPL